MSGRIQARSVESTQYGSSYGAQAETFRDISVLRLRLGERAP